MPFGTPQANANTIEQQIKEGYQFLMVRPDRETGALQKGRQLAGR